MTMPCHTDTICLPVTKCHRRLGQGWQHHSPSAPPAAGQGGLLGNAPHFNSYESEYTAYCCHRV